MELVKLTSRSAKKGRCSNEILHFTVFTFYPVARERQLFSQHVRLPVSRALSRRPMMIFPGVFVRAKQRRHNRRVCGQILRRNSSEGEKATSRQTRAGYLDFSLAPANLFIHECRYLAGELVRDGIHN